MGTGSDEALQGTGKTVRELAAGGVHKSGGHIAGIADALCGVIGALHQRNHQHLIADAEGTVGTLVAHNGLGEMKLLLGINARIGIIQRIGCHGTVIGPLLLVDLLEVIIHVVLVDPVALFDVLRGNADMHTVLDDLIALGNVRAGDLMALLDELVGNDLLAAYHGGLTGLNGLHCYRHIVMGLDQHGFFQDTHS